jgi:putative ATP-binding cassette transporter
LCLGSLRENIIYPRNEVDIDATDPQTSYLDSEITDAFAKANVDYLVTRHGLDSDVVLDDVLSGGEKQSLCFSRILLRRSVDFAMFDEATSGMDEDREASLYAQVQQRVPCYVSVGHRKSLEKFHTHKLTLERLPGGGCATTLSKLRDAEHIDE